MKELLGLILVILISCKQKPVEITKIVKSNSTIEPMSEMDIEFKKLQEGKENKQRDFILLKQKKGFNFICYDKCENKPSVGYEETKKYGIRKPYDIKKTVNNDTLEINFKFISDCCLEYIGDVEKIEDTVKLSFKNISYSPCDCSCIYYYEFHLPIDKYQSKFIVLGDSLITKR
jgi:hypothetical protein